jgi:dienelactone hydrolase
MAAYNKDWTMALVRDVVSHLRSSEWSVNKLGTIGYCWGGRHSLLIAGGEQPAGVDAAVMCHPSLVAVPADIEHVDRPTLWVFADDDRLYTEAMITQTREILEKHGQSFSMHHFPGTQHGFAARGNENDEVARKARDDAFDLAVEFFKKYL